MPPAFRRILVPVRDALRDGRRTVLLVVAVGGTGFGLLAPIDRLTEGPVNRLLLPAIADAGAIIGWTASARSPAATQARAVGDLLTALLVLAWAAMAIAAVTILTHYIARASRRGADIGVRRAVGASRRDVFLALLVEAGVTAAAAVLLGVLLAVAAHLTGAGAWPGTIASVNPWPVVVTLALVAAIGLGSFLSLGFAAPENLLHPDEGQVNLQIPAVQLGCSLAMVLSSALLLDRGTAKSEPAAGPGPAGVIVQLDSGLTEPSIRSERFGVLLSRLEREVDHSRVSLTGAGDRLGLGTQDIVTTDCGRCYRSGVFLRYLHVNAVHRFVSPDSFEAGGMRLVNGRGFTSQDGWNSPRVAVVNRHLALRHFQQGQAIGRDLYLGTGWPRSPYRVVGIVDDRPAQVLGGAFQPFEMVYLSVLQLPPPAVELLVRGRERDVSTDAVLEIARQSLGGQVRPLQVTREGDYLAAQLSSIRWFGVWFGAAGVVVLLAGVAGTFGIVAMWVRSLAHELAVRRALGASRRRIMGFVLGRAAGIGVGGIGVGLFLFFVVFRETLSGQLSNLPAWQPRVFIGTALLLLGVALGAALLPAWRMTHRQPSTFLH
ncbi:MAG TPA: FtsX-like permease family protein [Gemmatimonadales bacterium]